MSATRTFDGPLGLVGAGYIGHLFAQQFALAGYEVRAWSPGSSVHTLEDRLELARDRQASRTVERLVVDGRLGVKSGRGFYDDNDQRLAELTVKLYEAARELTSAPEQESNA